MKIEVFAVYDAKSKAFMQPFYAAAPGLAGRMFGEACQDPSTALFKYPEDFVLYHIGTFDDASGELVPLAKHEQLARATDFKGGSNAPDA